MTPPVGPCFRADRDRRAASRPLRQRALLKLNLAALVLVLVAIGARSAFTGAANSARRTGAPAPHAAPLVAASSRPVPAHSIEEFLATTSLQGAAFSPDRSRILFSSDQTGVYNAFAVPASGGQPVQLTHSTGDAVEVVSYLPDDERFLYLSDQGGNELDHLYLRELDGTVRDLTAGERLKAQFSGWARDQRSFFVRTNERDPRFFDLYEVAVDGFARSAAFRDTVGFEEPVVSPDKRHIAMAKLSGTSNSDIWLHERRSGTMRLLTAHQGDVVHSPVWFSPDGRHLYLLTDDGHEYQYLARLELASGRREVVDKVDWDIEFATFSPSGRYCAVGVNDDGRTRVRVVEVAGWTPVALPELPDAEISSVVFSSDEAAVAFYASSSRTPKDLFTCELAGPDARQLTRSLSPQLDPQHLVQPQVVHFDSYDGVRVPGVLYLPHGAGAAARVPAVVWVHGGPGGQSRVAYHPLIQYLANHGYAVYAINNRGSSGYGKSFFRMDDRKHGEADLGDVVACKQMLIATGAIDPQRIGILGGSYGGFMVLAAMAFRPDEFAVGVDLFGVANWVRTLESIPPWWESMRAALYQELGDPAEDRARLERISPLFHAGSIRKPLLVLQGANDPRVLKQESDDMVAAARANGAIVEYIVFDDEGHGFVKKANQARGYGAVLTFLDQHLGRASL
jgi:dipeptidyl aminopeptidase/acylaminoacyl peptidase